MAEKKPRDVVRLARMALDIERKRVLCTEMQQRLDAVARTGVTVDGERWILGRLQSRLGQALSVLNTVVEAPTAASHISQIESILSDPEWNLAQQTLDDLATKDAEQQRLLREYEPQIARWEPQLAYVRDLLSQALRVRAPVNREGSTFLRVESIVARAGRELDEQQLGKLAVTLTELDGERQSLPGLITAIQTKIESSEPIVRQADLLLLRSERLRRSYQFTLLLRTPSTPGSHGVNIQDSSTVVEEDHRRLRDGVKAITGMVNQGLARQFAERSAASAPAGTPLVAELRDLIPVGGSGAQNSTRSVNELAQDTGDLMYDLLMPQDMQRYLKDTPCSITITTNDLELPWELLWDDQSEHKFLCLERPVARMPMGRAYPRPEPRRTPRSAILRFLLVYADPTGNLPAARAETQQIKSGLEQRWGDNLRVDVLELAEANGERINDVLRSGSYDVIHYAGHARFDAKEPNQSALLLHRSEELSAEKIGRLLKGRPLVFLNACESGRAANEAKPQAVGRYLQRPAEGLATAFIYGGALAYIGAAWPVYDDAAAHFAIAFYNHVIEGYMIGEAMRQARLRSKNDYPNQITWASFILYGDPTMRLPD